LLSACQAIDFRRKEGYALGKGTQQVYDQVRAIAPYFPDDAIYYPYVVKLSQFIDNTPATDYYK
jgi:histidine ammonia-lyase